MPSKTVVTASIQNVAGNLATSGYVEFTLQPQANSLAYRVSGTAIIAPASVRATINASGLLKAENGTDPLELWGNDTISPANTFYRAKFFPDGEPTQTWNLLLIQGASYDLMAPQFFEPAEFVPNESPPRFQQIESNIIPAYDGQYVLGTDQKKFAAAYIQQLFADSWTADEVVATDRLQIGDEVWLTPLGSAALNVALIQAALADSDTVHLLGAWDLSAFDIPSNSQIIGAGPGHTLLRAVAGGVAGYILHVPSTSSNVRISNLTMDGNRSNQGMVNAFSAPIYIEGSLVTVDNCEVKGGTWAGIWIGAATLVRNTTINSCYIHDNGGVVNNAGNGIGILGGGATTPQDIEITNCVIENNYNTITKPNDSSGINLEVKGVIVANNRLRNNFNVNGGQIVLQATPDQTGILDAIVIGNQIVSTTTFGTPTDRTGGIEIQGRKFSISGNTMRLLNTDLFGIGIGGDASHASGEGSIAGNYIEPGGTGIDLDPAGLSSGITSVVVTGNIVKSGVFGINTQAAVNSICESNDFTTCGQAQAGTIAATMLMRNNLPNTTTNSPNGRDHVNAVSVASANNLTLGNSNRNEVTGATQINLIDSRGWYDGDIVTLYFSSTPTVKSGQVSSGNFKTMKLNGGSDFSATQFDTLSLMLTAAQTIWLQVNGDGHNA